MQEEAYLTRDGISLMIQSAIETYDLKVSVPRHAENQAQIRSMKEILDKVCTVLTKIEGGFTAFKWIGGLVAFAWTLTQVAHTALTMVQALHGK